MILILRPVLCFGLAESAELRNCVVVKVGGTNVSSLVLRVLMFKSVLLLIEAISCELEESKVSRNRSCLGWLVGGEF